MRFFTRLDAQLVPALGTSLLVGSVVLIGIAVPPAFREAVATGRLFDEENSRRVETLLIQAGVDQAEGARLASSESLRAGQQVLRRQCIECHDLRTVLAQPRTPNAWRQTVRRMADRTTLVDPLDEEEQWQVTAYLVALSPQLQQSVQQLREQQDRRNETKQAAATMTGQGEEPVGLRRGDRPSGSSKRSVPSVTLRPGDEEAAGLRGRCPCARRADGRRGPGGHRRRTRADRASLERNLREDIETVARCTTVVVPRHAGGEPDKT